MTVSVLPVSSDVYYNGVYWNQYAAVRSYVNANLTGRRDLSWMQHFRDLVGRRVFKKALILNCGIGSIERQLFDAGLLEEAVGIDIAQDLLDRAVSAQKGRPFRYLQRDINQADFGEQGFDLVVNHAAAHHIQFIDRVFRAIASSLPADGIFLNFDYVGPHRNQYPKRVWEEIARLNESLPADARASLTFPDLETMLQHDPTEAIHSELVLPTFRKYFHVLHHGHAGGAVAYPLLTHNTRLWEFPSPRREAIARMIVDRDRAYTEGHPGSSLFDYFVGTPNHAAAASAEQNAEAVEQAREDAAARIGGVYYYPEIAVEETISFMGAGWGRAVLHRGFSYQEPAGVWVQRDVAVMRFSVASPGPYRLELEASPLLAGGAIRPQRIYVCVSGRLMPVIRLEARAMLEFDLPDNEDRFEVQFVVPDLRAPIDFAPDAADTRTLSIMLHQMRLSRRPG